MVELIEKEFLDIKKVKENSFGIKDTSEGNILSTIQTNKPFMNLGDSIGKICSSFYYVYKDALVEDLANDLEKLKDVFAIGVVDTDKTVIGIIVRKELYDLLGKNYGRDIYKRKSVERVTRKTRNFNSQKNIFSVAEELKKEIYKTSINYYLITDSERKFYGIFSTKDLLMYLSDITQNDIDLAKKLQGNIVKEQTFISSDKIEIIGSSRMAKGVGGDFYNIKRIDDKRYLLAICDVCGKGISASLVSAVVGAIFDTYDFNNNNIENFIVSLNRYIYNTFKLERYLTAIFVDFYEDKEEFIIYDMGHSLGASNLYLIKKDSYNLLKTTNYNLAIGLTEDITTNKDVFRLNKNEIVAIITDGLTDQRNSKEEDYGSKRFLELVKNNFDVELLTIKDLIFDDINNFKEESHQQDDITFIMLKSK